VKLYLDDERDVAALMDRFQKLGIAETPEGWTRCYWPIEAIEIIKTGKVETLSLDHDLGDADRARAEGRKEIVGEAVINWLEEQVMMHGFSPPKKIYIHSMNPTSSRMQQTAHRILSHGL